MADRINMGIGNLGFSNAVFKRKFRYTFEIQNICGNKSIPQHFVRTAARPSLAIEEYELNFLNATKWIPGKAKWETITVSYFDAATTDMAPLFSWLASVYNFTNPVTLEMGSQSRDYSGTAILRMYDGCGALIDRWILKDVWPTAINFGDLDYSSSDTADIELTLRYSDVIYEPVCPAFPIDPCCSPCGSGPGGGRNGGGVNTNRPLTVS